ncbi:MAG: SgcJ/EcaC family oxidoreductase [Desulforhopalus sp.]
MAYRSTVLALCLFILPMFACAQQSAVEVKSEATVQEDNGGETLEGVRSTLQNYLKAFQAKDIEGVMAVFADAPNTVLMGTGPDEIWLGKDNIRMAHHAFFGNFEKESSERTLVSVGANGDAAWLTGYITVTEQNKEAADTYQINLSIVLERVENTWYITAMHFSNLTGPQ